jgi:hypothetical protein
MMPGRVNLEDATSAYDTDCLLECRKATPYDAREQVKVIRKTLYEAYNIDTDCLQECRDGNSVCPD